MSDVEIPEGTPEENLAAAIVLLAEAVALLAVRSTSIIGTNDAGDILQKVDRAAGLCGVEQ